MRARNSNCLIRYFLWCQIEEQIVESRRCAQNLSQKIPTLVIGCTNEYLSGSKYHCAIVLRERHVPGGNELTCY